jgi:acyl-CoA thioesterase-1
MNRGLRPLFAGALGIGLFTACGEKTPAPPPAAAPASPPAIRILAFGDSLTAGKDLEDPDREAYPAVLERLLRAKGHDVAVTNAGVSGDTTANALARLDFSLREKPRLVIVALGSNDTFQGKPLADIETNLGEIVRRSRASGAVVLLCALRTFPNLGLYYAADYTKMFERVAKRDGALLAPFLLEGVAGVAALNLPDMIHPNARGQERVAANLLPHVEKALQKVKP